MKLINKIGLANVLIVGGVFIGLFAIQNFVKVDFQSMTNIILLLVIFIDGMFMYEHETKTV